MTSKKTQAAALTPRQVTLVFEQIAATAVALDGLLSILETEALDADSDRAAVTTAAVLLNQRVGLLAEVYSERCGLLQPTLVRGGVDAWLMPQAFSAPDRG